MMGMMGILKSFWLFYINFFLKNAVQESTIYIQDGKRWKEEFLWILTWQLEQRFHQSLFPQSEYIPGQQDMLYS